MKAKVSIITDLSSAKRDNLKAINLIQTLKPNERPTKVNGMLTSV